MHVTDGRIAVPGGHVFWRRFGERLGLLHDPLRGTCGPPTRRGLGGSPDQRVDDGGPYVLI